MEDNIETLKEQSYRIITDAYNRQKKHKLIKKSHKNLTPFEKWLIIQLVGARLDAKFNISEKIRNNE